MISEIVAEGIYGKDGSKVPVSEQAKAKFITEMSTIWGAVIAGLDSGVANEAGLNAFLNNWTAYFPGTGTEEGEIEEEFIEEIEKAEGEEVEIINNEEGMNNNREARREIAEKAVEKLIEEIKKNPEEAIKLYGHSHGGNVAKEVTRMLKERGYSRIVDKVVFLGTPHRDDYKLNKSAMKKDGKVINAYNPLDWVQNNGGYGGDNILIKYFIGEHGPAKQTIDNGINVKVTPKLPIYYYEENKSGLAIHKSLDSKEVIEQICRKTNTCKKK